MQLVDIRTTMRSVLGEPNSQGRFSDVFLNDNINRALPELALDLQWPECTISTTAAVNVQEYVLPPVITILRVYVGGQLCVPTDIPILEGTAIEFYDQSTPTLAPQWKTVAAASYPVASSTGFPQSLAPFFPGVRPSFYLRGGNIGFVPPPANTASIAIDVISFPALLVNDSDVCLFPDAFKEALVWKALEFCYESDDKDTKSDRAYQKYLAQKRRLVAWRNTLVQNKPDGPMPTTYRTFYSGNPPPTRND